MGEEAAQQPPKKGSSAHDGISKELSAMNDNLKDLKGLLVSKGPTAEGKPPETPEAVKEKAKLDEKLEEAKLKAKLDELAERTKAKQVEALKEQEDAKAKKDAADSKKAELKQDKELEKVEASGAKKEAEAEKKDELKEAKAEAAK